MKTTAYAGNTPTSSSSLKKLELDEDIVCAPSDRGMTRREDRVEPTSGVPAVLPRASQGS